MGMDGKSAMDSLVSSMSLVFPSIAGYEAFGSYKKRNKRNLSIKDLCKKITTYPIVVVPLGKDKSISHAVCVIDDLIFDSTQAFAFQLRRKSLDWIVQKPGIHMIDGAIRFNRKSDKNAPSIKREPIKNW